MPILGLGLFLATGAWAGGLRCSFGEVVVDNLKIGRSYSLQTLANLPLTVTNSGDQPATVRIDALLPGEGELRQGALPIPSVTWATVRPDSFLLGPGEARSAELVLAIPDDERLFGRKFEVIYWSHTLPQPGSMLAYGLKSRVIFSIDSTREASGASPDSGGASIEFSPARIVLERLSPGREYKLEDSKHRPLVVKNTSNRDISLELQFLSPQKSDDDTSGGYADLIGSAHLTLAPTRFSLGPGEEKSILGTLVFPKSPVLKGRRFMGVISATVVGLSVRTQVYSRIFAQVR